MAERFFASLECELIDRRKWKTFAKARMAISTWIEAWSNPSRRHSGLGQQSPVNFEKALKARSTSISISISISRRVTQRVLRTCGQAASGA